MSGEVVQVGVGASAVLAAREGTLATYALGSCLAVTLHDPVAGVGAMLHAMLAVPAVQEDAAASPDTYLLTGLPRLRDAFQREGGRIARAAVCAAGAAELLEDVASQRIGARNWAALRKICFKLDLRIAAHDVGGNVARNMLLDLSTGRVVVSTGGQEKDLWTTARPPGACTR